MNIIYKIYSRVYFINDIENPDYINLNEKMKEKEKKI